MSLGAAQGFAASVMRLQDERQISSMLDQSVV
jgi:hypothetical protein